MNRPPPTSSAHPPGSDGRSRTDSIHSTAAPPPRGAIVVLAKCPLPGHCKTRLMGLLGQDGSATLARAMLSDVLRGLSGCTHLQNATKILLHAPGNEFGAGHMMELLESLCLPFHHPTFDRAGSSTDVLPFEVEDDDCENWWHLLPILEEEGSSSEREMSRSDLGTKLADGLERARALLERQGGRLAFCGDGDQQEKDKANGGQTEEGEETGGERRSRQGRSMLFVEKDASLGPNDGRGLIDEPDEVTGGGPVLFLGMDSPELPLDDIAIALQLASLVRTAGRTETETRAYLCPADDGGYGMLCLPPSAPPSIFRGVRWSNRLTALSQLKALSDAGIELTIGTEMHDVDEPYDVMDLAERLCHARGQLPQGRVREGERDSEDDVLKRPPPSVDRPHFPHERDALCRHTWGALIGLELVVEEDGGYVVNKERWQHLDD